MPKAFILLNTQIGFENQVLKTLKTIKGVEEAHGLWGVYDIIVYVHGESMEELKKIISQRIDKVEKINSKLTMLVSEHAPIHFDPHRIAEEKTLFKPEAMAIPA